MTAPVLGAVINISEGRDQAVLAALAAAAGTALLDVHVDADHHRSVWTLGGPAVEDAARSLATAAVAALDLRVHAGAHPRIGVLDVVPWVPYEWQARGRGRSRLACGTCGEGVRARNDFARWLGRHLEVPVYLYGPGVHGRLDGAPTADLSWQDDARSLPEVRRQAWQTLPPDAGPAAPHPSAGATAVGARPPLVAYNLWLAEPDLAAARLVAGAIRGPGLRTLGLQVGASVQVSCNLIDPWALGPGAVFDAVASRVDVARAELVGLVPAAVLDAEPPARWPELDLDPARTIEARLAQAGLDGGSGM